jgi:ArsR family transcriptional regulator, arsenate/arsenite/antimonite-responsive transcriptional repressor
MNGNRMMTLVSKTESQEPLAQKHPFPEALATQLAALFRVLGDETRLRILFYLQREQEINVRTFCSLVTQSQPAVSHHLALLKEAGLVDSRRDGKNNFYRLVPEKATEYLDRFLGDPSLNSISLELNERVISYGKK